MEPAADDTMEDGEAEGTEDEDGEEVGANAIGLVVEVDGGAVDAGDDDVEGVVPLNFCSFVACGPLDDDSFPAVWSLAVEWCDVPLPPNSHICFIIRFARFCATVSRVRDSIVTG